MTQDSEVPELPETAPAPGRKRIGRLGRWLLWIGGVVLVILVVIGGIVAYLFRRAEPMLRAALIDTLQKRFQARVELDDMHLSIVDGFQVECRGLRIWLPKELTGVATSAPRKPSPADGNRSIKRPMTPAKSLVDSESPLTPELNAALNSWRTEPWIVVGKMHFHASWHVQIGKPIEISVIHVEGVQVLLPPKQDRPKLALSDDTAGSQPVESSASPSIAGLFQMPKIVLQRIECNDALLVIERVQEPGKNLKMPLDFRIRRATLIPDGHGGPVGYEVELVNAKPVGIVHTTGHFGPWVPGDPGALPLEGDYTFDHADLSTIPGIAGILSSSGRYSGSLRRLEVDGQTKTPDFRLERVSLGSGVSLTTSFHAVVDGTNGDTRLEQVNGVLGHTQIRGKGQILRADNPDGKGYGHDTLLDVGIDRGRIEDILEIAANREQPFVTGNLTLGTTHFHLPPGPGKVWDKLFLEGVFHLSQARFSNSTMQGRIEELSLRGQGKQKEARSTDPASILSDMQGHFKLAQGTLQLPDLDYRVPGAEILVHGSYGLQAGTLAFEGEARLEASLSKVVGGWKGILLKPADGWLRKNGAGTDLPIHINGTRQQPKFGVDFDRLGKTEEAEKPAEPRP